jgi:hypothetical protein
MLVEDREGNNESDNGEGETSSKDAVAVTTDVACTTNDPGISGEAIVCICCSFAFFFDYSDFIVDVLIALDFLCTRNFGSSFYQLLEALLVFAIIFAVMQACVAK